MGFDAESRDRHRIYWPEKRKVSVERNVKFNFGPEEVVVGSLPLEGEEEDNSEHLTAQVPDPSTEPVIEAEKLHQDDQGERLGAIDPENSQKRSKIRQISLDDQATDAELTEGRGKRIQKETEYVRLLREGSGVTGSRREVLPKGMQSGTTAGGEREVDKDVDVEHAMATMIENVQGLMPTYAEAKRRLDWIKWEEAIKKELNGLDSSGTWRLVKQPPNVNIVDLKWVLRIKKNAAGEIDKYKARLVARGFTQIYGVDYFETYSPVARLASFRLLMAIAARNGWLLDNFDFDQAFLNSTLDDDEVIYLEQPPGYERKDRRDWVYQLLKSFVWVEARVEKLV